MISKDKFLSNTTADEIFGVFEVCLNYLADLEYDNGSKIYNDLNILDKHKFLVAKQINDKWGVVK